MSVVQRARQGTSLGLGLLLVFTVGPAPGASAAGQAIGTPMPASVTGPAPSPTYAGQGVPATAQELQSLVAPIALYPDALVAQILNAATFPDQIAIADYWLQQNKTLTGSALMTAVDQQTWDPSVKALTQFPAVLGNMAKNLTWTSQLGEAYHNQQTEVMTAVQTLRAQAKAVGNLKSGSQITVVQQSPQTIVIQPTNPQVVYVPVYNPAVIYGTPYIVPSYVAPTYTTGDLVAASVLSFGAGMAVGAMMSGGCCGWGYSSWNCNWHGGVVVYHGGAYYGNNAWHGGYYGGYNNSGYHTYNNGNYNHNNYNNQNYNHTNNATYNKTVNNNFGSSGGASHPAAGNSGGWGSSDDAKGWGSQSHSDNSSAFSGFGDRSGGSSFGSGGWGSRASSSRGWGSRGGGGGWGGGGGFRR